MISICVGSIRSGSVSALIGSITRQRFQDWELIIAAQGNDQKLLDEISQWSMKDGRIRLLHLQEFGRSRALNAAVNVAQGDIYAFTDDDCEVDPDWLFTIDTCFRQEKEVGIVAGDLIPNRAMSFSISTCPAAYTIDYIYRPSERGYVAPHGFYWIGGNVAVRNTAMKKIGPFDNYLGVGTEFPSGEDVDFGLRAEELDIAMWTTPKVKVYHTYGRRFGLKSLLKHHRGYALGQGALNAKLEMWGHRLAKEWRDSYNGMQIVRNIVGNPKAAIDFYKIKYFFEGEQNCMSNYELGPDRLLRPRVEG